ncbi:MAG: alginate lyase family protein [bacterium]
MKDLTLNNIKNDEIFILRAECLNTALERLLVGDVPLLPAITALRSDADAALLMSPKSVVDKLYIPPSGDKHDYMSLGPYWWPDPDTVDGLPYIRRDGEVNPESLNDNFDRERFSKTMTAIETLALAYYFTNHQAYAEKAAVLLRHWFLSPTTRMNPHLQYGQAIPGRVDGRDIGIIDTRLLSNIVDAIGLLDNSSVLSDDDFVGLTAWMRDYLDWLLTSSHGIGESAQHNNHGTWYDVQAASLACFTGQFDIARQVISDSGMKRINAHIAVDGSQPKELARTRSWDYSVMNLDGLIRLAELGRHVNVDLWHHATPEGAGILTAIDFLAQYADGKKAWQYQQIHEINFTSTLPYHLRWVKLISGDDKYERLLEMLPKEAISKHRVQLLYPG